MMQELSGHPLFCYDDRNQVIGLAGISFDSKMTQIQNLYHKTPQHSFLHRFAPTQYLANSFSYSKVRTAMFLDVQSQKDWILSVVEENHFPNPKPFWIRKRESSIRECDDIGMSVRENSGYSTQMSSTFWTIIFFMSLKIYWA